MDDMLGGTNEKRRSRYDTPLAVRGRNGSTRLLKASLLLCAATLLSYIVYGNWTLHITLSITRGATKSPTAPTTSTTAVATDPADLWRDDVYPLRNQTPWDISTNLPFPRTLEYDVTEGTWLRLDVHPQTGEIIFDMAGDVYCLPPSAYHASEETRAVPVLVGVPHDSDPHFSPDGTKLAFTSDAGLGAQNVWVMPWNGCEAMDVRPTSHATGRVGVLEALDVKKEEEDMLAAGVVETTERRARRLLREGRSEATRITNETYRWVTDARFHPSGSKLVATKWYTSARSLGAGEGWEYPVLSHKNAVVERGSGKRVVSRTLPFGWTPDQYGEQQIGPEQSIWYGTDSIIYAKNVADDGTFMYSGNVHAGRYAIFQKNLTTGDTLELVSSLPGGANRPELSRDGRTLAFVRRVRDKQALVLRDMRSGTLRYIWHGLSYDVQMISAPMGTYPSFAFTPSDEAIVVWAAGQIWRIPLSTEAHTGERIADPSQTPHTIKFKAHIEKKLAETRSSTTDILALETSDEQRVYAFKDLSVAGFGEEVYFQAAGVNYRYDVKNDKLNRVSPSDVEASYYSPSWFPMLVPMATQARWSDTNFTTLELCDGSGHGCSAFGGLPRGRFTSPIFSMTDVGLRKRQLAFFKVAETMLTGNIVATSEPGIWLADEMERYMPLVWKNPRRIWDGSIPDGAGAKLSFTGEYATRLLVQFPGRVFSLDLASGPDEFGKYKETALANSWNGGEVAVPVGYGHPEDGNTTRVAFVDYQQVYVVPDGYDGSALWSKPGNATKGVARVSLDGGHSLAWSGDGNTLFWFLGPYLHWLDVTKLSQCSSAIEEDTSTFGIECVKNLVSYRELKISHSSDIGRLKKQATAQAASNLEDATAADVLVITNATVVTMESGYLSGDLKPHATVVVRGGVITGVLTDLDHVIPQAARVINANGGFIVPGFIDVHAHWYGFASDIPASSWEHAAFLSYGITTLHNPSADTVLTFIERERAESGQLVAPRIFQTGSVIYGAGSADLHHEIVDMQEARSALIRIKVEGGPASFSYKNYNLPTRAERQRLLLAARNLSMLCVPEGGMNLDWDQSYIVDGMTTVEHNIPIPVLYDDILTLYAESGTGSTPTHIVNYGGPMGQEYIWGTQNLESDPKLRRFVRHDVLATVAESTARPMDSWQVFNVSISVAKMVHRGMRAHIGAHGQPPMGLMYHGEMFLAAQGGLTNYEVFRAATSDAAKTLGLHTSLGSVTKGKLADFLIYQPGVNILEDSIRDASPQIRHVVRGGRVFDAETLEEEWPMKGKKLVLPPINGE